MAIDGVSARKVIPATPDVEIIAQKLFYRAWAFTGRDLYDFATIARYNSEVLNDARLKRACADRRASLAEPKFDFSFDVAKAALLKWMATF